MAAQGYVVLGAEGEREWWRGAGHENEASQGSTLKKTARLGANFEVRTKDVMTTKGA